MRNLFLLIVVIHSTIGVLVAQNFSCATDEYMLLKQAEYPQIISRRNEVDSFIYNFLTAQPQNGNVSGFATGTNYIIPVVYHVVYLPGTPIGTAENVSDATIQTSINNLNLQYSNSGAYYNANGTAINIQFCLATKDTLGNATTGIDRVASNLSNLNADSFDLQLKNLSRWDPIHYLNIWVVKQICFYSTGLGCSVGGYAYFPYPHGSPTDGVVCRYSALTGRTLMHETGHYLNLYHTFNSGCTNSNCLTDGDKVCDTSPSSYSSSSCNVNSCSTDTNDHSVNNPYRPVYLGGLGDQPDPQVNIMSYSSCNTLFTLGQAARMYPTLLYVRYPLLYSHACGDSVMLDAGIDKVISPDTAFGYVCRNPIIPSIQITNRGMQPLYSATIQMQIDGNAWQVVNWSGLLYMDSSTIISFPSTTSSWGIHTIKFILSQPNGQQSDHFSFNDTMSSSFYYYDPQTQVCSDFNDLPQMPPLWYFSDDTWPGGPTWIWRQDACSKYLGIAPFHQYQPPQYGSTGSGYSWNSHLLRLPNIDMSQFSEARLTFKLAHKSSKPNATYPYMSVNKRNCQASNFSQLMFNYSYQLATVAGYEDSTFWVPQSCSDWQTRTYNICYMQGDVATIEFKIYSDSSGQDIFLDSVCISTVPKPNAGIDRIVCSTTTYLSANSIPGGYWQVLSGPTPYSFSNTASPTASFSGVNNATYKLLWYKPANGCFSSYRDTVIIKFSKPSTPTVNAPSSLCQGNNISLTASTVPNTTYSWFGPNSFSSTLQNPTISNASTLYSGMFGAFVIDTNGCSSDTVYRTVQVKPLPVLSPIASDTSPCLGASINLSCIGTATTYTWTGTTGSGITTQNGQAITFTPSIPSGFTYKVTGTLNGCVDSAFTSIIVRPTFQTNLNTTICQGDSLEFFGQQLKLAGNFTHILQAVNGCDSTIHLALGVSAPSSNFTANICSGQQFYFDGQFLSQGGIYRDTATASNGCDSVITLSLYTHASDSIFLADEICPEHFYQIGDSVFEQAGSYIVPFTNQFGCDSIVHLYLTISPPIDTVLTINGQSLSVVWDSTATYRWINCSNGQVISGASSNTYLVTQNGNYAAIISVDGCSDTTICAQVTSLSVDEISQEAISVTPNPSTGIFTLSISTNSATSIEVSFINILGEKLFTRSYIVKDNFKVEFDLSAMADGIYFSQILFNNRLIQKKLVLSK